MSTVALPSISEIRAKFPSLSRGEIYMDNAGGSQVPGCVADAVRDYMLSSYVQIGGDYPASRRATQTVEDAHVMVEDLMGVEGTGKVVFGSSSSTLCRMLANCYAEVLREGDEIIVAESGHEANISPWRHLANRGLTVRMWEANSETGVCELETLQTMLSSRTRVVALPHVSNILGQVEDIGPCVAAAKAAGARVVLDGVAYAPHLLMSVAELGVDWYVFSCYKVFGPHMGAMFGSHEAMAEIEGPNHDWVDRTHVPYKFELGGANHESCAGLLALRDYINFLSGHASYSRASVVEAFKVMEAIEAPLTARFLGFLSTKDRVRVLGPASAVPGRVPTIAFHHENLLPIEISDALIRAGIGIKHGNFYSYRLLRRMGYEPKPGVARVSFAHYNTSEEVDALITALDPIL